MTCEKCLDKDYCPLYRDEPNDTCWYEKIRKEREKKLKKVVDKPKKV